MTDVYKKFTPDLYEALYKVEEFQDTMRLDQFCAHYLVSFSRQQIKKKIRDGDIKIYDRPYPHKASTKVYHRERVEIKTYRDNLEDEFWNGEKLQLELEPEIIFEDNELIVISKPSYMATHPTGKHLFNCATVYFENKLKQTIYSIHRLDRETSGILLLAKNVQAAKKCTLCFEESTVLKCYFFIAQKDKTIHFPVHANERLGVLDSFIPRIYNHSFPKDSPQGKHALTVFEELYQDDHYIIGLAFPKTGRQHQIRSHAAHHGFPLLGDKLYNGDPTIFMRFKDLTATKEDHHLMQLPRHALHALAQKIPFPSKESSSFFITPIPTDLKQWIQISLPHINTIQLEEEIEFIIKDKFNE